MSHNCTILTDTGGESTQNLSRNNDDFCHQKTVSTLSQCQFERTSPKDETNSRILNENLAK